MPVPEFPTPLGKGWTVSDQALNFLSGVLTYVIVAGAFCLGMWVRQELKKGDHDAD